MGAAVHRVGLGVGQADLLGCVALVLGAMAPDVAYALDGSGLPVWPFSHQWHGLIGWILPLVLVGAWIVRRAAPLIAAHLPSAGPLALQDYGSIRTARHRWWVTAYSGLLCATSHLVLDRVEARWSVLEGVLDVAGVVLLLAFAVYLCRKGLLRAWYGDPPQLRTRPVLFWGVASAVTLPVAATTPFLPAAHLSHTTGVRLLCAVAAGLLAAAATVHACNRLSSAVMVDDGEATSR